MATNVDDILLTVNAILAKSAACHPVHNKLRRLAQLRENRAYVNRVFCYDWDLHHNRLDFAELRRLEAELFRQGGVLRAR